MTELAKVADEKTALLEKTQKEQAQTEGQEGGVPKAKKSAPEENAEPNYLFDYLNHAKYQFLFLFDNLIFFFLFRNNIHNDDNFLQGVDACFSLRVWSSLVMAAYFTGILIRIGYLILMAVVIYFKKEINRIGPNANKHANKKLIENKVKVNLLYKWFVEKRDHFLGGYIVIGIFLLVGMTIATTQNEPCGNLRGLALFWIYIYNIVFFFFPITMLIMCLYPYNIACKIFSGFLKFYNLQIDIFENPVKRKSSSSKDK